MVSYDDISYTSKVHRGRHIERLAAFGFLRGLNAELPGRSTVLEIGCGTGEALIPMALEFPTARFVGIDSSEREIAHAADLTKRFEIDNISFQRCDIREFKYDDSRKFDYILCHGVYSWCDDATRAKILEICSQTLTSNGIALISYNAHPGSQMRSMAKQIVSFYDTPSASISERSTIVRSALKKLIDSIEYDFEHPYNILLHREITRILEEGDQYLFHEVLAEDVKPFLISEFLKDAATYDMQFLGDARFSRVALNRMLNANLPAQGFQNVLQLASDQTGIEQTMDFLFGTPFRETLLCRQTVTLRNEIEVDTLKALAFSGYLSPEEGKAELNDTQQEFYSPRGTKVVTTKPLLKAVFGVLQESYPNYIGFAELLNKASERVRRAQGKVHEFDENVLAGALLEWMQREVIDFAMYPPKSAERVYAHPLAAPFARWQAVMRKPITNIFYETVSLDPLECALIPLLNGITDGEKLHEATQKLITEGAGGIKEDGEVVTDPEKIKGLLEPLIESSLETIRRAGILTSSEYYEYKTTH